MVSKSHRIHVIHLAAEADGEVGFGHLSEMRAVARALTAIGIATEIIGIGSPPKDTRWNLGRWVSDAESALAFLVSQSPAVSIWSIRRPLPEPLVEIFRSMSGRKVWLTDQPIWLPPVDLLIVPTAVQRWQRTSKETSSVLFGPTYFPLDPIYGSDPLPLEGRGQDVLLTLGGADRTGVTLRLLSAIAGLHSTVVVGPGFRHRDQVVEVAYQLGVSCIEAPETLYRLLRSHRLVISSGGNTLYEAAATGTPTFVTWEDPHEEEQALAFMAAGATRVLGQGTKIDVGVVREMIGKALESPQMLSTMAQEGRRLVDGHGARRIVQAILGLESREKAAWSGDRARSLRSVR